MFFVVMEGALSKKYLKLIKAKLFKKYQRTLVKCNVEYCRILSFFYIEKTKKTRFSSNNLMIVAQLSMSFQQKSVKTGISIPFCNKIISNPLYTDRFENYIQLTLF